MPAPIVILGAGCAGLSLAAALAREGARGPIVLLERRRSFTDDRTWCFWRTDDNPYCDDAAHAWSRWTVGAGEGGRTSVLESTARPYLHLPSPVFRERAMARAGDDVELRLGVRVDGIALARGGFEVRTSAGSVRARAVFDALAGGSPLASRQPRGGAAQAFLGLEVVTDEDVFDPGVATLMDLSLGGTADHVRFMYVLPFGRRRALVEDTTIGLRHPSRADRQASIGRWLAERGAGSWQGVREERGHLPMAPVRDPSHHPVPGVVAVGQAAGAIRPSSGYAFTRIQRHVAEVARAFVHEARPPRRLAPAGVDALDGVFVRALEAEPAAFGGHFAAVARALDGDAFARFMSDEPRPTDVARVIAALPKRPFVAAAVRPGRHAPVPAPLAA